MQLVGGEILLKDHGRVFFDALGGFSLGTVLLAPESKGSVEISS